TGTAKAAGSARKAGSAKGTRAAVAKVAAKAASKSTAKAAPSTPRNVPAASKRPAGRAGGTQRKVFFFGGGRADGDASMKEILGGKGANLAEMTALGIPVPPGFTISTEVCAEFNERGKKLPAEV